MEDSSINDGWHHEDVSQRIGPINYAQWYLTFAEVCAVSVPFTTCCSWWAGQGLEVKVPLWPLGDTMDHRAPGREMSDTHAICYNHLLESIWKVTFKSRMCWTSDPMQFQLLQEDIISHTKVLNSWWWNFVTWEPPLIFGFYNILIFFRSWYRSDVIAEFAMAYCILSFKKWLKPADQPFQSIVYLN
jgi:hypothetical protein